MIILHSPRRTVSEGRNLLLTAVSERSATDIARRLDQVRGEATETSGSAAVSPAVAAIVSAICADARRDALKYAQRSDTWQDGE